LAVRAVRSSDKLFFSATPGHAPEQRRHGCSRCRRRLFSRRATRTNTSGFCDLSQYLVWRPAEGGYDRPAAQVATGTGRTPPEPHPIGMFPAATAILSHFPPDRKTRRNRQGSDNFTGLARPFTQNSFDTRIDYNAARVSTSLDSAFLLPLSRKASGRLGVRATACWDWGSPLRNITAWPRLQTRHQ